MIRAIYLALAATLIVLFASACSEIAGVDFGAARLKDATQTPQSVTIACDKECADYGFECGTQFDACGKAKECGACPDGKACVAGKCGCAKKACAELGMQCGTQSDGCGGASDCGKCANPSEACVDGQCKCQPKTCAEQGTACGNVPDGCGAQYSCGTCPMNKNCGQINDGCGNILQCGSCSGSSTCGGSGVANVCGCNPTSCAAQGKNCGPIPDGCGGALDCGACGGPNSCSGGGIANVCGCTSNGSCSETCGTGTDNCGNTCTRTTGCGGGGGGGGCFGQGTPVRMADGSVKPIERVEPGELVVSYDPRTGAMVAARVVARLVHGPETSNAGFIVRDTPNGTLRVTPNHPLMIDGLRKPAEMLRPDSHVFAPRLRNTPASFQPHMLDMGVRSELVGPIKHIAGNGERTWDLKVDGPGTFFAANLLVEQKQIQNLR